MQKKYIKRKEWVCIGGREGGRVWVGGVGGGREGVGLIIDKSTIDRLIIVC